MRCSLKDGEAIVLPFGRIGGAVLPVAKDNPRRRVSLA